MLAIWKGVNAYWAVGAGKYKIHATSQMKVICKTILCGWGHLFLRHTIVRMVDNSPLTIYKAFSKSVGQSETFVWEQAAEIHRWSRKRKCSISLCYIMLLPTWISISCRVTGLPTSDPLSTPPPLFFCGGVEVCFSCMFVILFYNSEIQLY